MTTTNDNKAILARNIQYYLDLKGKERQEMAKDLGFNYSTVCNWFQGVKYPRIDKIEKMAQYFGVNKSELIEAHNFDLLNSLPQNAEPINELVNELFADRPDVLALLTNGVYDDEGIYAGKKLSDLSEPAKKHLKDTILSVLEMSGYLKSDIK